MHVRPKTRGRAFTLLEALVVVTTIALLVTILLPSLQLARESARKSACATNLHLLGVLILTYATEHNGDLPPYDPGSAKPMRMTNEVANTLEDDYGAPFQAFYCPSQQLTTYDPWPDGTPYNFANPADQRLMYDGQVGGNALISYMYLMNVPWVSAAASPRRLYQKGENLPLFADQLITNGNSFYPSPNGYTHNHTSPPGGGTFFDPEGGHKLLIDGHVEWLTWEELTFRYNGGGEYVYW